MFYKIDKSQMQLQKVEKKGTITEARKYEAMLRGQLKDKIMELMDGLSLSRA